MNDFEIKSKKWKTVAEVVGACAIAFFLAPFVFTIVQGLAGIAVAGTIALVGINLMPAIGSLVGNMRLSALKAIAARDPIGTLENIEKKKTEQLRDTRDNLQKSFGTLKSLKDQIDDHDAKFPGQPSKFMANYLQLKQILQLQGNNYQHAQVALAEFHDQVEEKRADWKIQQGLNAVSKQVNAGEQFQQKLMQDTAFITVQDGLNAAFSELDMSLLDEQAQAQIAKNQGQPPVVVSAPRSMKSLSAATSGLDLGFDISHLDKPATDEVEEAEVVPAKASFSGRRR